MTIPVPFDTTPDTLLRPQKTAELGFSHRGASMLSPNRHRVALVGTLLSSATVDPLTLQRLYEGADQAGALFGYGSELHRMALAAIAANPYVELIAVGEEEAIGGTARTVTLTFTGPASSNGGGKVWIGFEYVLFAIDDTDAATAIAIACAAAINADTSLPFTAAAVDEVVTLTAKTKGAQANEITVSCTLTATGAGVTVADGVSGATDPDFSDALDVIHSPGFGWEPTIIAQSLNTAAALADLKAHLALVADPRAKRYAHGFVGFTGTLSAATTLATGVNGIWNQIAALYGTRSVSYEIGAAYAAVVASEEDPARPHDHLEIAGIDPPQSMADRWDPDTEEETLLDLGVIPLEVGPGEVVRISRTVTTYRQTDGGSKTYSVLDMQIPAVMAYCAKDLVAAQELEFPREKMTARTKDAVLGLAKRRARMWEEAELIENAEEISQAFRVEEHEDAPGRLDCLAYLDVVEGMHIIANKLEAV